MGVRAHLFKATFHAKTVWSLQCMVGYCRLNGGTGVSSLHEDCSLRRLRGHRLKIWSRFKSESGLLAGADALLVLQGFILNRN